MRFKTLTIQNFKSFGKQQIIDFECLEKDPLFLISGKTGAGKSSIFDALCVALYGSPLEQNINDVFPKFVENPKAKMEIILTFEHLGHEYTVQRSRQKNGGASSSYLYEDHNEKIAGWKNVSQEIQMLFPIRKDEFKQFILIPQGKITKFLEAAANNKQETLLNIFPMPDIDAFTEQLKNKVKACKSAFETAQGSKKEALKRLAEKLGNPDEEEYALLVEAKEKIENLLDTHQMMQQESRQMVAASQEKEKELDALKQLHKDYINYKQAKQEQAELQQQKKDIDLLRQRIADNDYLRQHQVEYDTLQREQKTIEAMDTAQHQRKAAIIEKEAIYEAGQQKEQKLHQQLSLLTGEKISPEELKIQLEQEIAVVNQKKELQVQCERQSSVVDQLVQRIEQKKEACRDLEEQKKHLEQCNIDNDTLQIEELHVKSEAQHLQEQKHIYHDWLNIVEKKQKFEDNDAQLKRRLSMVRDQHEDLQQQMKILGEQRFEYSVDELVEQLRDGEPCPICGSIEHPAPKQTREHGQSLRSILEHIDQLEMQQHSVQQELDQLTQQQTTNTIEIRHAVEQIEEYCKQTNTKNINAFEESIATQEQEYQSINQHFLKRKEEQQVLNKQYETLVQRLDHLYEERDNLEKKMQKAKEDLLIKQTQYNAMTSTASLDKLQKQYDELDKVMTSHKQQHEANELVGQKLHECRTIYTNEKQHLQQKKAQYVDQQQALSECLADKGLSIDDYRMRQLDDIDEQRQRVFDYDTDVNNVERTIQKFQWVVTEDNVKKLDTLPQIQKELTQLKQDEREMLTRIEHVRHQCEDLQKDYKYVQENIEETDDIAEKYTALHQLQELIIGERNKRGLQQYMLWIKLREAIIFANERLETLADGKFQLILPEINDEEAQDLLDIQIINRTASPNQPQTIKSLSGGEKFQVALALALSFSDMLQKGKGNLDIQTLFIDEGFGTLDTESLQQVLHVLEGLKENGRMIGIISHVDMLKDMIPTQLIVQKDTTGQTEVMQ